MNLHERMKQYEAVSQTYLMRRTPVPLTSMRHLRIIKTESRYYKLIGTNNDEYPLHGR